jgi:hypothetical protein
MINDTCVEDWQIAIVVAIARRLAAGDFHIDVFTVAQTRSYG